MKFLKYIFKAIKKLKLIITLILLIVFVGLLRFDYVLQALFVLGLYLLTILSISITLHHDDDFLERQKKMEEEMEKSFRRKNE